MEKQTPESPVPGAEKSDGLARVVVLLVERIGGEGGYPQKSQNECSPMSAIEPRRRGGQPGNRNALKHGRTTREAKAFKAMARTQLKAAWWAVRHARYIVKVSAILARIRKAKSRQTLKTGPAYPCAKTSTRSFPRARGNPSRAFSERFRPWGFGHVRRESCSKPDNRPNAVPHAGRGRALSRRAALR
jgi:hypothetical protein